MIKFDVYKTMTSDGPRKIKTFFLEIFMPYELDSNTNKILQSGYECCLAEAKSEGCVQIKMFGINRKNLNIELDFTTFELSVL